MIPKFRIELFGNGKWYSQIQTQKETFFKRERWDFCVFYNGTTEPFGYETRDKAIDGLLNEIKRKLF